MTGSDATARLKDVERIESAIESKTKSELQWAIAYCERKVQKATQRDHLKYWLRLGQSARGALADVE